MDTRDIPTSVLGVPVHPVSEGYVWMGIQYPYMEMQGGNDKCCITLRKYTCTKHNTHQWEAHVRTSLALEYWAHARDASNIEHQLALSLRGNFKFESEGLIPPWDDLYKPPGYVAPKDSTLSPETRLARSRRGMSYRRARDLGGVEVPETSMGQHGPGVYLPLTYDDRVQVWLKLNERSRRRRQPSMLMFFPAVDDYNCKCLYSMAPRIGEEQLQERLRIQSIRIASGWYSNSDGAEAESAPELEPEPAPEVEQPAPPTEAELAIAAEKSAAVKRRLGIIRAQLDVKYANWKLEKALFSEFLAGFAKAQK